MLLAPYYREFELPWEGDEEANQRFKKILRVLLIILALFGILFPLLPSPKHTIAEEVPEAAAATAAAEAEGAGETEDRAEGDDGEATAGR